MTGYNLEGSGVTISFSSSGFSSDLISIQLSDRARETIETTHLGTTVAKTFKPGEAVDLGTIEVVFDHNPAEVQLVGNPSETITITYPLRVGQSTADALQVSGLVTKQGGQRMEMDQRMVTRVGIRLVDRSMVAGTGGGGDTTPPSSNLLDPSKLLGAFPFTADSSANVCGSMGAFAYNFYGYAGYSAATISGGKVVTTSASKSLGSILASPVTSATWSVLFTLSTTSETPANLSLLTMLAAAGTSVDRTTAPPFSSTSFPLKIHAVDTTPFGYGGAADGTTHYFAITFQVNAGVNTVVTLYVDGVFNSSYTVAASTNITAYSVGFSGDNSPSGQWGNLIVTTEIVTLAAIAAHAAGHMPDGSGVLV